ncbi:undecaprenyl-diphosphate phosphatase [Anaerolentibacter hominis]|uniref:undecaprenyl-diphosphate phosphatase n=1 Tax=Anaerolentibacter hominis TaxID=3079009 RepID=UPI0031B8B143
MQWFEIIKAVILGIVEGITEWLPISSTGHMILVDEFLKLGLSDAFKEMFFVVIQLGAILAVVVIFWKRLIPFTVERGKCRIHKDTVKMWLLIILACIPAGIAGILWDDEINQLFYNYQTVANALIVYGVLFLLIEWKNKGKQPVINSIAELTIPTVLVIGLFQLLAAVIPGTSRSGATIFAGILMGTSRSVAAEFTFYLAVPVMLGASVLKLAGFGFSFTGLELAVLAAGMVTAFVVSMLIIRFLMNYVKKHDFRVFGWYRIALGVVVLIFFRFFAGA